MKIKLLNILTAGILFLMPNVNFAQAPTLGTSADFVLFSSVGAVTNSGITFLTKLTGHVGANSGAISGFGNVDGNMYAGGPQSALCATDLLLAYNQLNATVPTFFPAPLLGNGQILAAGVYSISAPATLNLNLILDAAGNPNAVFIFQIQGALSANPNSKVKLINGAKACNVFWKVEGLVSMAANVLMRGTVIANNAAINMNAGDTLDGRALAINGAVTVSQILGYTPIGCGSPLLTGPAAPALASTACYAIFSSNGPVNNVGVTSVIGDIGSNLGSALGYNPLLVVGTIHPIPDISTSACATDLGIVYTYLNTLPADILLLYPAQFGNNLVLTPHTYLMNGATMLTDSVFLNAEGNANAVFVIQINGALNTSASSKVVLINGAQSKNVYWKVDGAVTISTGSIFKGTIVCNNAAINLNTGVFLDGRALTTNGALSTSAVTVTIPSSVNIISQPTDQTTCIGSSASFTVGAAGLTYQWRKGIVNLINGGNISGANTATLTINPVGVTDVANNYNVIVSGACASNFTSTNVSLTLGSTSITSQPSNQNGCPGNSVSFTTTATGAGLSYQWRKGITNLINGGNISGATTATLTINPVSISDAANNYNVVITGACAPNATSTNVSLTIGAVTIVSQPSNQTTCPGSSINFTVAATGGGLTYQWRKGITNLINGGNISGATTATLNINPVNVSDAAINYNVVISGTCAPNDTSNMVSLSVNPTPTAVVSNNSSGCLGSPISLSAQTVAGGIYNWTGPNSYTSSAQNPTILNSTILNAGTYSLNISMGGCVSNPTTVVVTLNICSADLSVIKTVNNSQPVIGQTVVFTITAKNNGPANATGVSVMDILQSGYTYVSSSATMGAYNSLTGIWTIGTLNNGMSAILNIVATVNAKGVYVNTASISSNATDTNSINDVSVIETFPTDFFIPEGFSPNGDGINDLFVIRGINNFPENKFLIFNRWGDKVLETNNYQNTWNGKTTIGLRVGGDELPVGTYFYLLDLNNGTPVYKGTIYLNR